MEKQLQVWALKKTIRPVLLNTLAAMHVTCNRFLMYCFDFSKFNNDFSFQKVHFFKAKIIKTVEKGPHKLVGVMVGSVVHVSCNFAI